MLLCSRLCGRAVWDPQTVTTDPRVNKCFQLGLGHDCSCVLNRLGVERVRSEPGLGTALHRLWPRWEDFEL